MPQARGLHSGRPSHSPSTSSDGNNSEDSAAVCRPKWASPGRTQPDRDQATSRAPPARQLSLASSSSSHGQPCAISLSPGSLSPQSDASSGICAPSGGGAATLVASVRRTSYTFSSEASACPPELPDTGSPPPWLRWAWRVFGELTHTTSSEDAGPGTPLELLPPLEEGQQARPAAPAAAATGEQIADWATSMSWRRLPARRSLSTELWHAGRHSPYQAPPAPGSNAGNELPAGVLQGQQQEEGQPCGQAQPLTAVWALQRCAVEGCSKAQFDVSSKAALRLGHASKAGSVGSAGQGWRIGAQQPAAAVDKGPALPCTAAAAGAAATSSQPPAAAPKTGPGANTSSSAAAKPITSTVLQSSAAQTRLPMPAPAALPELATAQCGPIKALQRQRAQWRGRGSWRCFFCLPLAKAGAEGSPRD